MPIRVSGRRPAEPAEISQIDTSMIPRPLDPPTDIAVVTPYRLFDGTLTALCRDAFAPALRVHFRADSKSLDGLPEPPDLIIVLGTETINAGSATLARFAASDTKIIALCSDTGAARIRRYITMGIRGIVHASRSSGDVIEVLRFVWKGGVFISPEFWASGEHDGRAGPPVRPEAPQGGETGPEEGWTSESAESRLRRDRLTARQREILRLVRTGASNKDIARQLTIAESTVKTHLHLIMRIIGVRSRAELIALPRSDSD
jgi:DNA-binding NarL/FixJ family response regulator